MGNPFTIIIFVDARVRRRRVHTTLQFPFDNVAEIAVMYVRFHGVGNGRVGRFVRHDDLAINGGDKGVLTFLFVFAFFPCASLRVAHLLATMC